MTLYDLKPRFQTLLRPTVGRLAAAGITANQVTVIAALGSLVVATVIVWKLPTRTIFLLLPIWLFLRMALNAIDGMLAREHAQKSKLGAYLNEICDVISDALLYAPFGLLAPFGPFWIGSIILLSAVSEIAGVLGQTIGASRRYDGPMGKSDRALVFGALGLWIGVGGPLPDWLPWLMIAIIVLLIITIINRIRRGLAEAGA